MQNKNQIFILAGVVAVALLAVGVTTYSFIGGQNTQVTGRSAAKAQEAPPTAVVLPPETQNIVTVAGTYVDLGDGGLATAGSLTGPEDVVSDSSGNVYIAEFNSNRVRKVSSTGIITTFAGNGVAGSAGDGGPATAAQVNAPRGLAFDPSGNNLYIGSFAGNSVRKVNLATGIITTVAGTGDAGYAGDGGLATAAQLRGPQEIDFDSAGNLYIADFDNRRIRKVDMSTGIITTFAGNGVVCSTTTDSCGDGGPAASAQISNPRSLAFDSSWNLYVTDNSGFRVRKISPAGIITTFAGTGVTGSTGDGGLATAARFSTPSGVVADSGNLYIGDFDNNRVRKVNLATGIITNFAGTGVAGSTGDGGLATAASFNGLRGLNFDPSGNLYITEFGSNRIRKVDMSTGIITTFAGGGSPPLGDGGPATAAQLNNTFDVAVDTSGNQYIVDIGNNRIRKVSPAGIITTFAGGGISLGDGGPATSAQLNGPRGVAVDSSGNVYISEFSGNRIRKVNTAGIITTVAGTGTPCSPNTALCGDGGPATSARLSITFDVDVDSAGNFYFTGNNRIRKVDKITGVITTVAGTGVTGNTGDGGLATVARLSIPRGIAANSADNLFIVDSINQRVRKVDKSTGIITNFAGTGVACPLSTNPCGDGGPATSAQLSTPGSAAIDSSGNVYIGDATNNRIRKVDKLTGIITTVAGTGDAGYAGDGGLATSAWFSRSRAIAFDPAGNIYIADAGNNRVRRLNVAVSVDLDPDTLNITNSTGNWVTAYIQLPAGRDASQVNLDSVRLQAINPADGALRHSMSNQVLQIPRAPDSPSELVDTNNDSVPDQLMVKFNRKTVASWATGAPELVLRVEGQFNGSPTGTYFSGDTQVRNIYPPNPSPSAAPEEATACDPELDPECVGSSNL